MIIWIDDLLGHAKTLEEWFVVLENVLLITENVGLVFSITKCVLLLKEVKWCGKIFSATSITHDPERIRSLVELPSPCDAQQLQQFIYATQWMARTIPQYVSKMLILTDLYESIMAKQPKRTRACARRVSLSTLWEAKHDQAFQDVKQTIARLATLASPDPHKIQCIFGDASERMCGGMVTQIPVEDKSLPPCQMRHEPLGFWGHKFTASQQHWKMSVKEGFVQKELLFKMAYLFPPSSHKIMMFSDHKNLLTIFSPEKWNKPKSQMLERWSMEMQDFHKAYIIYHIDGEKHYMGDIISRWEVEPPPVVNKLVRMVKTRAQTAAASQRAEQVLMNAKTSLRSHVRSFEKDGFVWPSLDEIQRSQQTHLADSLHLKKKKYVQGKDGVWTNSKSKILIPTNDVSLRLRIVIVAHCGEHNGHVGKAETLKTIRQVFTWQKLDDDVGMICDECLHCYPVRGGHRVPRPLGEQVHGTRVGQVLHTDVLYVEDEAKADSTVNTKFNCIIVLYCDFSGLTWLVPCLDANAEDIASVLASWRSRYKTPEIIVSDQASYFKSQFVKAYLQKTGTKGPFSHPRGDDPRLF